MLKNYRNDLENLEPHTSVLENVVSTSTKVQVGEMTCLIASSYIYQGFRAKLISRSTNRSINHYAHLFSTKQAYTSCHGFRSKKAINKRINVTYDKRDVCGQTNHFNKVSTKVQEIIKSKYPSLATSNQIGN